MALSRGTWDPAGSQKRNPWKQVREGYKDKMMLKGNNEWQEINDGNTPATLSIFQHWWVPECRSSQFLILTSNTSWVCWSKEEEFKVKIIPWIIVSIVEDHQDHYHLFFPYTNLSMPWLWWFYTKIFQTFTPEPLEYVIYDIITPDS